MRPYVPFTVIQVLVPTRGANPLIRSRSLSDPASLDMVRHPCEVVIVPVGDRHGNDLREIVVV